MKWLKLFPASFKPNVLYFNDEQVQRLTAADQKRVQLDRSKAREQFNLFKELLEKETSEEWRNMNLAMPFTWKS